MKYLFLFIWATFGFAFLRATSINKHEDAIQEINYDSSDDTVVPSFSNESRHRSDTEPIIQHVCSTPKQLRRKSLPASETKLKTSKDSNESEMRLPSRGSRERTFSFDEDEDDGPVPKDAFVDIPMVQVRTRSRRFSLRSSRNPSIESIPEEESSEDD